MPLITVAEAQQEIPELSGTVGADASAYLTALVSTVSQRLAAWCGYPRGSGGAAPTMERATYVQYLTGTGGRELVLPVWPVVSVTSVYDDPDLTWSSSTLVDSGDYSLIDAAVGRLLLTATSNQGAWSTTPGAIKVTYIAGNDTPEEALRHAARVYVRHLFERRRSVGRESESNNGASATFELPAGPVPPAVRELARPYRLPGALL